MLTRQLSLCVSKRWACLSQKSLQSCQLTTASTSKSPNIAPGVKRCCANQAAASTADASGTPASFVLSAARDLADAGVSAAGLATYAEKASRYRHKACFFLPFCPVLWLMGVLFAFQSVCLPYLCMCAPGFRFCSAAGYWTFQATMQIL